MLQYALFQARTKKKNKKQSVKKEPRPVVVKEYKVDALGILYICCSNSHKFLLFFCYSQFVICNFLFVICYFLIFICYLFTSVFLLTYKAYHTIFLLLSFNVFVEVV